MKTINRYNLLFLLSMMSSLGAQTLEITDFKQTDKIEARINKVKNDNNENCALLNLTTALDGSKMVFESSLGICKVEVGVGVVKVYVSPQERNLSIGYPNFEKLEYTFQGKIEPLITYEAKLRSDVRISQKLEKKLPGILLVRSVPSGAKVYMDGEFTGMTTPFQKPVSAGPHEIILKKELYADYIDTVNVLYEETLVREVNLETMSGSILVSIKNPLYNPDIWIGDQQVTLSSKNTLDVEPGDYTLKFSSVGYRDIEQSVKVLDGKTTKVSVDPKPLFAYLTIPTIADATLKVNGQVQKFGKIKVFEGITTVEVSKSNFELYKETLQTKGGVNKTLAVKLKPLNRKVLISFDDASQFAVQVDGIPACVTPCYTNVKLGEKTIGISFNGQLKTHKVQVTSETNIIELSRSDFGGDELGLVSSFQSMPVASKPKETTKLPPSRLVAIDDQIASINAKKYTINTVGYLSAIGLFTAAFIKDQKANKAYDEYKNIPRYHYYRRDLDKKWDDVRSFERQRNVYLVSGSVVGLVTFFLHMRYNNKIKNLEKQKSWYSNIEVVGTPNTIGFAVNF